MQQMEAAPNEDAPPEPVEMLVPLPLPLSRASSAAARSASGTPRSSIGGSGRRGSSSYAHPSAEALPRLDAEQGSATTRSQEAADDDQLSPWELASDGGAGPAAPPATAGGVSMMSWQSKPSSPGSQLQMMRETYRLRQERIQRAVQRDIQRTIASAKTLTRLKKPPPTPAAAMATTQRLAVPVPRFTAHPDIAINIPDPIEYAQWKTDQLKCERLAKEREAARLAFEQAQKRTVLTQWHDMRQREALASYQVTKQREAAEAAYSRQVASFVREKAMAELAMVKAQKQLAKEQGRLLHESIVAGFNV